MEHLKKVSHVEEHCLFFQYKNGNWFHQVTLHRIWGLRFINVTGWPWRWGTVFTIWRDIHWFPETSKKSTGNDRARWACKGCAGVFYRWVLTELAVPTTTLVLCSDKIVGEGRNHVNKFSLASTGLTTHCTKCQQMPVLLCIRACTVTVLSYEIINYLFGKLSKSEWCFCNLELHN